MINKKNKDLRNKYQESKLREISFPLGGLGTGCIGLSGNGRLIDWEIFNKPNKGSVNGFSHFSVKAEKSKKNLDARILNGGFKGSYMGILNNKTSHTGYGFGPARETMLGIPHFENNNFLGEFPFAKIKFSDKSFPGQVNLMAFNPFIPTNDIDSGIPAAFFEITIKNNTEDDLDYTLAGTLGNPFCSGGFSQFVHINGLNLINLSRNDIEKDCFEYGDLTIATDAKNCSYQEYWYRGEWSDALEVYWHDFKKPGMLKNRNYSDVEKFKYSNWNDRDHSTLAVHQKINSGTSKKIRFVITWNMPNNCNYWKSDIEKLAQDQGLKNHWKNYYSILWDDSKKSAQYSLNEWVRLYQLTLKFKTVLFQSSLPKVVIEGISANLSVLKSPTVLRLSDGTFYAWEGVKISEGCCEGSCTHVWNYAQALAFLFPKLERSMRLANYKYNIDKFGGSHFRLQLPLGLKHNDFRPCADGQFGDVMKTYRDWKISGDIEWLKEIWPSLKKTIKYAWSKNNYDRWDPEKTGILQGRQHHTLDMELFGPNAWLTGYYLGALKAASEMASSLGEESFSLELLSIFYKGKKWADNYLFNGEYYGQKIDLHDRTILEPFDENNDQASNTYWSDEHKEIKYQVGEGVEIDMVIAQWHANLYGLGEIFDFRQVKKTLKSTFKYNYKSSMQEEYNPYRLYSLNDEAGLMICTWPENKKKPVIPLPYSQETQNGYEWAAASHMIQSGLIDEGITCIKAIRKRYDGEYRNPWNEIECGSNYARSLASYSLLNIYSGFQFDMVKKQIGFEPLQMNDRKFQCFWSLDGSWGELTLKLDSIIFQVIYGNIHLEKFILPKLSNDKKLIKSSFNDKHLNSKKVKNIIEFREKITLKKMDTIFFHWE